MNLNYPLPGYLSKHRQEILNIFSQREPDLDIKAWLDYFVNNDELSSDINSINHQFNQRFTRANLTFLAEIALGNHWPDIRRLFLAIMMWGYVDWEVGKIHTAQIYKETAEKVTKLYL